MDAGKGGEKRLKQKIAKNCFQSIILIYFYVTWDKTIFEKFTGDIAFQKVTWVNFVVTQMDMAF